MFSVGTGLYQWRGVRDTQVHAVYPLGKVSIHSPTMIRNNILVTELSNFHSQMDPV